METESKIVTAYVSIGNSDNKLSQYDWFRFAESVRFNVNCYARQVFGEWYSLPNSMYQNACWGFSIHEKSAKILKGRLADLCITYRQESIAWVQGETELIKPPESVLTVLNGQMYAKVNMEKES